MLTTVKIERHNLKNGRISLFLTYYPYLYNARTGKTIRSENLHMFLIENPVTPVEKKHNRDMEELVFSIQSKRILQLRNEEFGFLDTGRREEDFLAYFRDNVKTHLSNTKWDGCYKHFARFCRNNCTFGMLNADLCNRFKKYLLTQVRHPKTGQKIHQNTAAGYITTFRVLLKQAYKENMIEKNLNDQFDPIKTIPSTRGYLTQEEFERLAETPCKYDVLKRASIFAVFSALRYSDIWSLEWENIVKAPDGGWCIQKVIQKTGRPEVVYISDEALEWCGPRGTGRVFSGLTYSLVWKPFKAWIKQAGIEKPISFHCLRHTAATLMCSNNIDIYTVSSMLTHKDVQTTQRYAAIIDPRRRAAANSITLKHKDI